MLGACLVAWWAGWAWWALEASGSYVAGISWHYFVEGGHDLVHGAGLHVYAQHPELQIGPLALVVEAALSVLGAGAAKATALVLMALAGPLLVLGVGPCLPARHRTRRLAIALVVVAPAWLDLALRWGHLDDVLAMVGAVGAVRAVHAGRGVRAGLWLAFAMAAKPWAIGFVPLVVGLPAGFVAALSVGALGTLAAWSPFLIGDSGTLGALRPPVGLVPHSGLHLLGARGDRIPAWGRTLQLLLTAAVALVVALSRRWAGVLIVALATRLALDSQDNAYYIGSAALAALVFDLVGTSWTVPWTTVVTTVVLWQPYTVDYLQWQTRTSGLTRFWFAHPGVVAGLHLAWAMCAVLLVLRSPGPRAASTATAP